MTKYDELIETVNDMDQLFNALKTRIYDEFVKGLSQYLECNPDLISIRYDNPQLFDQNDLLEWSFTLEIDVIKPGDALSISLPGFSLIAIKKTALEDPLNIIYKAADQDAGLDGIFDAIFIMIKKSINKASWI